jgi:predicted RNA-binding protein with PIN domain
VDRLEEPREHNGPYGSTPSIPAPLTRLIGRTSELQAVGDMLHRSRPVTLTGPAGAGKTRTAIELGRSQARQRADGVWFVEHAVARAAYEESPTLWRMEVLIVDGANVVGSRPDGWWRDRAWAARRLQERLLTAVLPHDEVVLVLEGKARQGNPAGQDGHLRTVHATESGDDAIVEEVLAQVDMADGREVTVVTADRVLRDRVEAAGARNVGPSWLLDQL